jgi:HD-GYP domain-containing protein (c-di-GMP phosphodiesterase class II)
MSETIKPTQKMTVDALAMTLGDAAQADKGPNAVMYAFFQLFKTAQIHAIDNQALQRPVQVMMEMTSAMVAREGRISFQAKDRAIFVNSTKLKLSTDEYELAGGIFDFFEERGMGGFVIDGALSTDAIHKLLMILVYAPPAERKYDRLDAALKASGLPFRINKSLGGGKKSDADVVLERRGYTFFTYSKLVVLYRSLLSDEHLNATRRQFLMKKIARTVQALVDICVEDDHTFIGAAAVKSGEAYAPHHAANVAILSISLGEKIGLSKVELFDLGMAAVFYDVGLRGYPQQIVDKPEPLDEHERGMVTQHPIKSVEFLLDDRKLSKGALARIVVAFEHHRHYSGGGFPPLGRRPHLFTRIISIADVYDALTTQRPWRNAYLPDEALASMLRESGKRFDPALLKIFVNALGLYPVGTLVRLDNGEMGVVVYGGGDGERATRPIVTLVGRDGQPGATLDLMEREPAGSFKRAIATTEDPAKYGLQTSSIIASSAGIAS